MTICFAEILVLVAFILCLSFQENVEKSHEEPCKMEKHYQSSIMTPLAEKAAEVTGCSAKVASSESKEIYVLSLLNSGINATQKLRTGYLPSISLDIRPHWKQRALATSTVIILHSVNPVMWQVNLKHVINSTNFNIIVNKPSLIVPSLPISFFREKFRPRRKFIPWILSNYGAITTFSSISVANKITLFIGSDIYTSDDCNTSSTAQTSNVEARFIQPVSASGCTINNKTEKRPWLLYIVELNFTRLHQDVLIYLQSHTEPENSKKHILDQNLILVLKSHVPSKWIIESTELQGSLHILAEYPVHFRTNPKYITAVVQERALPSDTVSFLNGVKDSFGFFDSFIKTRNANRINIVVKEKNMNFHNKESRYEDTSEYAKKQQSSSESDLSYSIVGNNLKIKESLPKAIWKQPLSLLLVEQMVLHCFEDQVKVTFPYDKTMDILTETLGTNHKLSFISLMDAKCKADVNESYIMLFTGCEECGTQSFYNEDRLIYHNQVQFVMTKLMKGSISKPTRFSTNDDEDQSDDGSGSEEVSQETGDSADKIIFPIPFHCTRRSILSASTFTKKYDMKIFQRKDFQRPIQKESFPLRVAPFDHIFAEATMDSDPRLCIIADECWIAERKSSELKTNKENILIKQGCANDLSVEILSNSSCRNHASGTVPHSLRFSFQLSEKFLNMNVYLNCYFSACATKDNVQIGINKCIEAENFCLDQSLRPYLNVHRGRKDFISRGPFHVTHKLQVDKMKELHFSSNPVESSSPENFLDYSFDKLTGTNKKKSTSPQLVLIGLSTEAVVGIAFASFVIGAGLMAALWLIHMHTEPSRQSKNRKKSLSKQEHLNYQCSSQLRYEDTPENAENFVPHSARPMSLRIAT